MKRLAWLTALATITTVGVLALADGIVEILAFELIVAGLVAAGFIAVGPLRPAHIAERTPITVSPVAQNRPPQLQRLEWLVTFATTASADAELRLIPELRDLAAARLEQRHGVDLNTDPKTAAALLGTGAWAYLDPQRPGRFGRSGLTPVQLETIVSAIEDL
ncbi:MAG: hypothetical protein BMS9Abin07_0713 [Acidimicrobiia bacterium]|nr:MAG: hypothetical protein BMS9Abin07_0713 [Acidimicrobiia bacterium]